MAADLEIRHHSRGRHLRDRHSVRAVAGFAMPVRNSGVETRVAGAKVAAAREVRRVATAGAGSLRTGQMLQSGF